MKQYSVPQRVVFWYEWQHPSTKPVVTGEEGTPIHIGEEVWVKPSNTKCTSQWRRGTVMDVHSWNNISDNGVPHYFLSLWQVVSSAESKANNEEPKEVSSEVVEESEAALQRSERETVKGLDE